MSKEIWMISSDEEIWNCYEEFSSKEEAIQAGLAQYKDWKNNLATDLFDGYDDDCPPKTFYVGKQGEFVPHINVDFVIEQIQQDAYDCAGEVSEDFLEDISKEQQELLSDALNRELNKWLNECKLNPSFYPIEDIETITID